MEKIKEFNYWNDHSRNYLEMAYRTDKQELLHDCPYTGKKKGMFMRLIDWVAQGAEKAQKGGGHCPT